MGFWGTLGSGLAGIGGALAAPFTGGASLLPILGGVAGLGAGIGKHEEDKAKAKNQDMLAAETDRLAPWTGLHGKMGDPGSLMGSAIQGAGTGLSMAQELGKMGVGGGGDDIDLAPPAPGGAPSLDPGAGGKGADYFGMNNGASNNFGMPKLPTIGGKPF